MGGFHAESICNMSDLLLGKAGRMARKHLDLQYGLVDTWVCLMPLRMPVRINSGYMGKEVRFWFTVMRKYM